jgi:hypothetical protein
MTEQDATIPNFCSKLQVSHPSDINSERDGAVITTTIRTTQNKNTNDDDDDISFTGNDDSPCSMIGPSRRKRVEIQSNSTNLDNDTARSLPYKDDESQNQTEQPDFGLSLTMQDIEKKEEIHGDPSASQKDQVFRNKFLHGRRRFHARLFGKSNQTVQRKFNPDDDMKDTDIRIDTMELHQIAKRMRLEVLHRANLDHKESSSAIEPVNNYRKQSSVRFKVRSMSLPRLLWHRELRGLVRGFPDVDGRILHVRNWQSQMLEQSHSFLPTNKRNDASIKNQSTQAPRSPLPKLTSATTTTTISQRRWRPYCHRTIPFRKLGTPSHDAVLGLDPTGSFVITVGEGFANITDEHRHSSIGPNILCIRLYGVPTSSSLDNRLTPDDDHECSTHLNKAPLLSSIPLDVGTVHQNEADENQFWNELRPVAPDSVPIHLWLSTDGCLGAAIFRHDGFWNRNSQSNIVLFPLPRLGLVLTTQTSVKTFLQLHNIYVPQNKALHDNNGARGCNLLWKVDLVPKVGNYFHKNVSHSVIDECSPRRHVLVQAAYLFLVDEEDGYRLTWVHVNTAKESFELPISHLWKNNDKSMKGITRRSNPETRIVTLSSESEWETRYMDTRTGFILQSQNLGTVDETISVCGTGFFSVLALLHDILSRRPQLVHPAFEKEKGAAAKLPTYSYHVVSIQGGGRTIEIFLVFSVEKIGAGCVGVYVEVDFCTQDYRELEWIRSQVSDTPPNSCGKMALERRSKQLQGVYPGFRKEEADDLSTWRLYPDCHTMDNIAVLRQRPVRCLQATSAPIEIIYG